ncbi:MAG: UDP-N-acetylglucosamine 1-carboxyvinyltransferase [Thermoguttaceae bacterium]
MTELVITGGVPLQGTVFVSGAKNAALPMMAAAILADAPVELLGVPRLTDVRTMGRLLRQLGVDVARYGDRLAFNTVDTRVVRARYSLVRRMRAGFCVLGPLLARRGRAEVPLPGGCDIGDRPVDLHLHGLAALGADLRLERGYIVATARQLRGATIDLCGARGPTVTGTANVLCAAVLARGRTVIHGAAREPEIVDLGRMLNSLGARIRGLGTPVIEIEGVQRLSGGCYRIIPDRIEAATLMLAAAITGGTVSVVGLVPDHLLSLLAKLEASGISIDVQADRVTVRADARPLPVSVAAEPYPGLPTDLQAHWTAFMATAAGPSFVEDRVFPMRWGHVTELKRLGAHLQCVPGGARVAGNCRYQGAEVAASDLRASAALMLAALAARGTSVIHAAHHLERGYERLDLKLAQLGARIERLSPQKIHHE